MAIGSLIGLWYGYTTKLDTIQKGRLSIMIKTFSLGLVFWSFYQLEIALILCCIIFTNIPSLLIKAIVYLFVPEKKLTKEELEIQKFREQPHLLANLSPERRKYYLSKLNDEHLRIVYDSFEEYYDSGSEDDEDEIE